MSRKIYLPTLGVWEDVDDITLLQDVPRVSSDGVLIDQATGATLSSPVFTWDSVTTDYAGRIQVFLSSAAENGTPVSFQKAIYPVGTGIVLSSGSLDADFGGATLQRISGTIANGPTTQIIKLTGMVGAKIKRLKIDGNKDADGLSGANYSDRCGGLVLDTCSYCEIYDVEIVRTTNSEDTAGLYPVNCFRCDFVKIRASYNDRAAIYPRGCDACSFIDVYTHHNLGTGLGGRDCDDCIYRNLIAHDEGYSQISLNGKRAIVDNVLSFNSPVNYAAVVLGHDTDGSRADGTVASNIIIRDCMGWGFKFVPICGKIYANSICLRALMTTPCQTDLAIFIASRTALLRGLMPNLSTAYS